MSSTLLRSLVLIAAAATPALAQPASDTVAATEPEGAVPAPETIPETEGIAEPAPAAEPVVAPGAVDPALIAALVDERLAARDGITWKDGFNLQSADGSYKLRIGGYTQFDSRVFVADDADKNVDQFAFRRIRPDFQGNLLGRADFRFLPDFAGGRVVVQDAWVDLKAHDAVKLQFGKFKEPFGLERLQSATALLFVERGLPTTLVPNRDLGIAVHGDVARSRLGYAVGVFNGVADGGSGDGDVSDDKEVAARVFVTPFAPDKGSALEALGVGVAATYGKKEGTVTGTDLPQLKTSGQATFFQYRTGTTVDDTALADGSHWRVSAQGHWYAGGAGVLAEYVRTTQRVSLADASSKVTSQAWQVAVNYVVAGGKASFKGATVAKPFDPSKKQWGALELAARYNELRVGDEAFTDVADPAKSAERARAYAAGVSWHLGRSLRFVGDYELTQFKGGAADGEDRPTEHVVLGRVQTVF